MHETEKGTLADTDQTYMSPFCFYGAVIDAYQKIKNVCL